MLAGTAAGYDRVMDRLDWTDAARALLDGGCVAVPTDTVYGLAVRVADRAAVGRLFDVKGRAATRAIAVLVSDAAMARSLGVARDAAWTFAAAVWPGALTVVVDRSPEVVADLGGDATSIGLRVPAHDRLRSLIAEVGPLATTSANASGEPALVDAASIAASFGGRIDGVVDGGRLDGLASTVVDLRRDPPTVLRRGAVQVTDLGEPSERSAGVSDPSTPEARR